MLASLHAPCRCSSARTRGQRLPGQRCSTASGTQRSTGSCRCSAAPSGVPPARCGQAHCARRLQAGLLQDGFSLAGFAPGQAEGLDSKGLLCCASRSLHYHPAQTRLLSVRPESAPAALLRGLWVGSKSFLCSSSLISQLLHLMTMTSTFVGPQVLAQTFPARWQRRRLQHVSPELACPYVSAWGVKAGPCAHRVTLEWMGWQQQALHRAAQADEVLITHVVDFNSSAVESLRRVADFVGLGRRMSDLKTVRCCQCWWAPWAVPPFKALQWCQLSWAPCPTSTRCDTVGVDEQHGQSHCSAMTAVMRALTSRRAAGFHQQC